MIPRAPNGLVASTARPAVPDTVAPRSISGAATVSPSRRPAVPTTATVTYKVKRGDTLGLIARKTGTTIAQLKNWNKLRTTNLKVGTRLLIQSPGRK